MHDSIEKYMASCQLTLSIDIVRGFVHFIISFSVTSFTHQGQKSRIENRNTHIIKPKASAPITQLR